MTLRTAVRIGISTSNNRLMLVGMHSEQDEGRDAPDNQQSACDNKMSFHKRRNDYWFQDSMQRLMHHYISELERGGDGRSYS
jgi:hypothetical protein